MGILARTVKRATRYAKRLRRAPAVGVLLNDGSIVQVPLRRGRADLKRLRAGR